MDEQHSPSLEEAISNAWAADEASSLQSPAPASPPEAAAEASAEKEGQNRDESGRFAKVDEPDDFDEAVGLDRETWKLTPAQARERAKALAKEAREAGERAKAYEPLDRVLAPRRDALRASWGDEGRAIENLFHLSDWAQRDFGGFVRHLAEQRGVDLRSLMPATTADPNQPPDARAVAREEARRIVEEERVAASIQEFDRNAAYEFRSDADIRRVMAGLLSSGAAADLPTAYEMAIKAHPTISAKLAERASAEQAKRDAEDAARRAAEKAAAAVSVRGAPGTARVPTVGTAPTSIEEAARAAWDTAAGRI